MDAARFLEEPKPQGGGQSRSVTWLPRFLGWRAIVSKAMMASTPPPSGTSSSTPSRCARCWRRRRRRGRKRKKEEKEEEEEEEKEAKIRAHLHATHSSSWYQEKKEEKRRRKKRKKKKLPKTFARAPLRCRQAQMLGIMAGLDQKNRYAVMRPHFSSTMALVCTWLVFLVTLHLALCSCVFVWPQMLRIMAGTHQKDIYAVAGFTGDDAPRAVLLFFVVRPKMFGIMAGMTQKDSCLGKYRKFWFFWDMTSYVSVFSSLVRQWMHIYVSLQRPGLRLQKTAEFPQLQFIAGHRHLFRAAEADLHGPDYSTDHRDSTVAVRMWWSISPLCGPCSLSGAVVEKTFVLPQLHLVEKLPWFSAVAVHQGRSHSCLGAEADPYGPCDHGESTVAVRHGFFVPVLWLCSSTDAGLLVARSDVVDILSWLRDRFPWSGLFKQTIASPLAAH